jgi:hypothetical protein
MNAQLERRPPAYFVGRRPYEAPEVYAVTRQQVKRLRPAGEGGVLSLDWEAPDARALELSHVLLTSVAYVSPSRDLQEQFVYDVLAQLPDDGFVLDSDSIWKWLLQVGQVDEFADSGTARRSWLSRLWGGFRRAGSSTYPITGG